MDYKQTLQKLLTEMDGDGIDILDPEQETAFQEPEVSDDTNQIVDLANLMLQSLKYKPTQEVVAYTLMPAFRELKPFEKLTFVRNTLADGKDRIVQEEDEFEGEEGIEDFGDVESATDGVELDDTSQADLLRLILRALRANPDAYVYTIPKLPTSATVDNYEEVVATIEQILT